ncbi:MAG TPA: hypothetical protein VMW28_06950 [Pelolinea sp.]|nr:hypothetical protein [Pelolinea sp.]
MPRTFKDYLPEKDYAGRLALGLGLLILSQLMTHYEGAVFMVLRWVFLTAAVANYYVVLMLYQRQKQDKKREREEETNTNKQD